MTQEAPRNIGRQFLLPDQEFEPLPVVVSTSRRTEIVGLHANELVGRLQRFEPRFKREIHSVVLWTKDPRNIYEYKGLREELLKYNLLVHFTLTGLAGTRIESTVQPPNILLREIPQLLEFLKDSRRLRWRFDPIVTLEKDDGTIWSSSVFFEPLASKMAQFGIDNCYFSFCDIYPTKFAKRKLEEAGIKFRTPSAQQQRQIGENMRKISDPLGITLYFCTEPLLENIPEIVPAKCIDAELLTELHPQKIPANPRRDENQRSACYCTKSIDIGSYIPCGEGCAYCYAEAAVPPPEKLLLKPMPWEACCLKT